MLHSQALCSFSRPVAPPSAAIPASALRFQSGRAYAMKLKGGKTGLVELELGEVADGYRRRGGECFPAGLCRFLFRRGEECSQE